MRRKPNHRLQKICGPSCMQMKNARRSRRVPSSRSPVRASKHIQMFSTTLSHMQSLMHALPLVSITDIPSHITCATPASVHASPDRRTRRSNTAFPGARENDRQDSYLMSFTRLLRSKLRTMFCQSQSQSLLFLTESLIQTPVSNGLGYCCVSSLVRAEVVSPL